MDYMVIPCKDRILFLQDEVDDCTRGGIVLPDKVKDKKQKITGRVLRIAHSLEHDPDVEIQEFDKVLVDPRSAIPVDSTDDNCRQFIIHVDDVIAIFRSQEPVER